MSTIPKFEDTDEIQDVPSFDDTTPEDMAADIPQALREGTDEEMQNALGAPDMMRAIKELPQTLPDALANMQDGVPGAGWAKKAGAGFNALLDKVRGSDNSFGQDYDKWTGLQKKEDESRIKRNPGASTAANMIGGTVAAPATAGLSFMKRVLVDAGMSAADAAGRADEMKDSFNEALKAGGMSAALNLLVSGAGQVVKGTDNLDKFAERRAVKSLDPILNQQEMLARKGSENKLGRELLDSDVVKFGYGVDDMAPRVESLLSDKGKRIGEIRDAADAAGAQVDFSQLGPRGEAMRTAAESSNATAGKVAEDYLENAKRFSKIPQRSIADTQKEIMGLSENIDFNKINPSTTTIADKTLRKDLVGMVDEQLMSKVPALKTEHDSLKEAFGLLKDSDRILDKSTARSARNADIGLRDLLAANAATKSGGLEGGLKQGAAALAMKTVRERGNSALAVTADKAHKLLKTPNMLGKYAKVLMDAANKGNSNFVMTHQLLMKDPEYKALVEQESVP